jgi:hypothetical protein
MVISKLLRWPIRILLGLLLLLVVAVAGFRLAAAFRETGTREALAPAAGRLVPTSSGGVFIQEKGPADGIPVVLFHGTAAWSELWFRTTDALAAANFRVIALDLPPFGFSDRPGTYTRADQAARINDVLGALKAAPAVIVGHSFGAGAATELVMRRVRWSWSMQHWDSPRRPPIRRPLCPRNGFARCWCRQPSPIRSPPNCCCSR